MKFANVEEGYITGLVTREEGRRLALLASLVPAGQCIVELGSHGGSSTCWLGMGVHKGKNHAPIYAVDLWDLPIGERRDIHGEPAVFRRFLAQIDYCASGRFLTAEDIHPVRGESTEVARDWSIPVGLLHVDALHTYAAVKADLDAWLPHVAPGGRVVMHDYYDRRFGVKRAGDELVASPQWILAGKGYYRSEWNPRRRGQLIVRRKP